MPGSIQSKLDQLANFQAEKDVLAIEKQELLDQILTAEIRARIEEIEAEFAPRLAAVDENIAALEDEIKQDVLENEATVRGLFSACSVEQRPHFVGYQRNGSLCTQPSGYPAISQARPAVCQHHQGRDAPEPDIYG